MRPILTLGLAAAACGPALGDSRTNLLLVSFDSVRADHVSAYGHRAPHAPEEASTPAIDQLAAEGILYECAIASSSWTLASHAAVFTGQPDIVHGVELDEFGLDANHTTLPEVLRSAGYRTSGFYSGPYLDARFGFARGFERYEDCYGDELALASESARRTHAALRDAERFGTQAELVAAWELDVATQRELEVASHRDVSSGAVLAAVLEELDASAKDGRPFFLFAHLFDPHYDYLPPAPLDTRFDPDYDGTLDGHDVIRNPAIATFDPGSPSGRRRVASERDLEHLKALYTGDLAHTDAALGRILERLEALGLTRNTLVVVFSDHGEEYFEHDGLGHRRTLFEEVLRVPLVMRLPGTLPAGERVEAPVALAGVMRTVLGLLGIPEPGELHGGGLESSDRGILSRLVARLPARGEVERLRVLEAFRLGGLKLVRERIWLDRADAGPLLQFDRLRWIDLREHPEEREGEFSGDFRGEAAHALLETYVAERARLEEARPRERTDVDTDELEAALRGLGY